ncbi:uncharacterized protein LOC117325066 [Pecten maximus]|uniref:uncharacterized protein LOC117325066 n=1 Tax=Pecten maximus TaxID=6579 RepID=UPI00145837D1|nr:uncharacterized protein LOC117325066 [Pecten maximus]
MASESDFSELLRNISCDLGKKKLDELKFIATSKWDIPEEEGCGETATKEEVLKCLVRKGIISKDNVSQLECAFETIGGCRRIRNMLAQYQAKIQRIRTAKERSMWQELVPNFIETSKCYEVKERLRKGNLAILRGIPAAGKSQICVWYASDFRKEAKHTAYKLMCQNEDDLLTSLRGFLEFLEMKFERQKEAKSEYIIHMTEVAMSLIKSGGMNEKQYLFIFDDVTEATCKVVERIIHSFHQVKNVKILCSTSYSKFYEQCTENDVFVRVEGVTKSEALQFFKGDVKKKNSEEDIEDLATKMGHLPYGLVLANSYMFTTGMSVKKYIDKLSDKEFLKQVETLISGTWQEYDKGLVSAQMLAIDKVENTSSVHVKSLLRFIPFLHHNQIPIRLLKKLLTESIDDRDKDTIIFDLIANVRKYCIGGEIESEHQTHAISIHAVTVLVLEFRLTRKEQEVSIRDLLCFFCKNISIDCRLHLTLISNLEFQPHASKVVVRAAEMESSKEKAYLFLMCTLHAAIGVSFRVGGVEGLLADEHLNKAKALCFQLIEVDPESFMLTAEEIDSLDNMEYIDENKKKVKRSDSMLQFFHRIFPNQEGIASTKKELESGKEKHRQNARVKDSKTEDLYKRLVSIANELPKDFIAEIVIQTDRTIHDLDHLEEVAEFSGSMKHVDERKRGRLSQELYDKLITKKLAIPRDKLGTIAVVEMMVIILYNSGRNHYYQSQSEHRVSLVCWNELRLAYLLGKLLREQIPDFPSVQSLITRRNGILYHCLVSRKHINESGKEKDIILQKIIFNMKRC